MNIHIDVCPECGETLSQHPLDPVGCCTHPLDCYVPIEFSPVGKIDNEKSDAVNITLPYPIYITRGEDTWACPQGADFFTDEHGIQWVKFRPRNGYHIGKEHMIRTENIIIIRRNNGD